MIFSSRVWPCRLDPNMTTSTTTTTTPQVHDLTSLLRTWYPAELFSPATPASASTSTSTSTSTAASGGSPPRPRPFVTLTYAQSIDAKIAGPGGTQIRLSGAESMYLTHALRALHDSILVGVGTVVSDDPQLSARLPIPLPIEQQPRPLILDPNLKSPTTCKLIRNHRKGTMPRPTFFCSEESTLPNDRRQEFEAAGARVEVLPLQATSRLSLTALLARQDLLGRSLMIEGGASVITAFLEAGLVDLLIITVAPTIVGEGICAVRQGLSLLRCAFYSQNLPPDLEPVETRVFGKDTVIVARPKKQAELNGQ
ncbi:BQ5605_C002g01144 [Microbotryum silenes-dioicae]|uniref:2,5-diamino-6-ribosylamino-4(3H)-pyrimidinone 5'-phosphate reductase n=1 Tax=Microbotryum silenes-dioicae TaxID=796604 RepID=A0A2X0NVL4_9BASI|nr:BQ5605_C002g01144 [Microbotryum silenes-dioicae]